MIVDQMRLRGPVRAPLLMTTLILLASCNGVELPATRPSVPIEYPIEHYRVTEDGADFAAWKAEVRELRSKMRERYPFEGEQPVLEGSSPEAAFLEKAVDPAALVWRDPAAFWRDPLTLSWWELIDESGAVTGVLVVTSNQTRETDARIIAWCLENKTWTPAVVDGRATPSIRSASISLGESKWHISHWQKRISAELAATIAVVAIALGVRSIALALRRVTSRRDRPLDP